MSANGGSPTEKRCFVVSAFGGTEAERVERQQVLKHLIRKVLVPRGYDVKRADEIDDPGQITHQIIERLLEDDLVVADLTGRNPNVFYELAVRHAARKPVITLMTDGEDIPFDLKDVRTVFYDLHNPDRLEEAQQELAEKVTAIERNPDAVRNPITVARDVALLQASDNPEAQAAGTVLEAITELKDEVRSLARRGATAPSGKAAGVPVPATVLETIAETVADGDNYTVEQIANRTGFEQRTVLGALETLHKASKVWPVSAGKWSTIPF